MDETKQGGGQREKKGHQEGCNITGQNIKTRERQGERVRERGGGVMFREFRRQRVVEREESRSW